MYNKKILHVYFDFLSTSLEDIVIKAQKCTEREINPVILLQILD